MRPKAIAALALAFHLAGSAGKLRLEAQTVAVPPSIDSIRLRAHLYFLSHDLLEGRGTGRHGHDVASLYLATEAARLGLVGPGPGGSYFQAVPLVEVDIDSARTSLVLSVGRSEGGDGTRRRFTYPSGFIPNVGTARTLRDFGGDLVFAGTARGILTHAERLPTLAGKVAVVRGTFGSEAAAADTLLARGAAGVVHLVGGEERYALYVRSRGRSRMYSADGTQGGSSFSPEIPAVIASPALEELLLADWGAGPDPDRPDVLAGRRLEVEIGLGERRIAPRNVAALLLGGEEAQRSEVVVLAAHYDHLGISTPDASGDSIYNGFSDNAAGAAMLLGVAEAMARGRRPARSVLLLWFTGEEFGLLGSDYFAAHPMVAPQRMIGAINLDAGAPPAPSVTWRIEGGDVSTLGQLAVEVARRAGWEARTAPATPNSDHFPLLRIGVPAVFLIPGPGAFEGQSAESSRALRQRWDRYHQASDQWAADFPLAGLVRYADFAYRLATELGAGARPRMITSR
ncbi:MAG: M28 family peptidase [Gemmatimonadetes bacterium]|nr:M28 family peptidase [Gemmatimonadota bacterium]